MPRSNPYGATFDEFLNDPDRRAADYDRRAALQESPHEKAARQHAEIVGLAEAIAPDIAREDNRPIDDVRKELTSGVRYPEPALTSFYHQTLGRLLGSPPQEGEPALARVSRLRGRATALDVAAGRRKEALGEVGTLEHLAGQMRDVPPALREAIGGRLKEAGIDVPAASLSGLRGAAPKSELEAWQDPASQKSLREMLTFEAGLKDKERTSAEMQDVEGAAKDLMALDPELTAPEARLMARGMRRERGSAHAGRASKDYDAFMKSFDGQAYQMAQRKDPKTWDANDKAVVAQHDKLARAADAELEASRGPSLQDLAKKRPRGKIDFGARGQPAPGEPLNADDLIDRALGGPGLGAEYLGQ